MLPALALKYLLEAHVAHVVYVASAYVAVQVEFIFQSGRCLPRIEPELRVDEARVDQLEDDSEELSRVSLHVKVEKLIKIVQLVELCPQWVQGELSQCGSAGGLKSRSKQALQLGHEPVLLEFGVEFHFHDIKKSFPENVRGPQSLDDHIDEAVILPFEVYQAYIFCLQHLHRSGHS